MSNHCNYTFITGSKKNTPCNRIIRGKESTRCYQHKPKILKFDTPIVEPKVEPTPMKTKGKPIKINDPEIKVITTKSNPINIPKKNDQSYEQLKIDKSSSSDSDSDSDSSDSYSISSSSSDYSTSSDSD